MEGPGRLAQIKHEEGIYPITALAFLHLDRVYILAGKAHQLYVYEGETFFQIAKIFKETNIHGISTRSSSDGKRAQVLIWGARSVSVVEIAQSISGGSATTLQCRVITPETLLDKWILHGCFKFKSPSLAPALSCIEIAVVTTSNELFILDIIDDPMRANQQRRSKKVGRGPHSLLYSAHVVWSSDAGILIAAGTVFGLVYLWSITESSDEVDAYHVTLHCTLSGHHGSVFGVQLSEQCSMNGSLDTRLLASCSDDRTVRIYAISLSALSSSSARCDKLITSVAGHSSRIWAVHFLHFEDHDPAVVSYGEDASTQIWHMKDGDQKAVNTSTKHSYHAGKNIWAAAIHVRSDGEGQIVTGGADGKIVSLRASAPGSKIQDGAVSLKSAMSDAQNTIQRTCVSAKTITSTRKIFDDLEGSWMLSRRLMSAIPTYPSGSFTGTGAFTRRKATDNAYDGEYVYSESGTFVTQEGMTLQAARQYIYRYEQRSDQISAWFVKITGEAAVDYLFHILKFSEEDLQRHEQSSVMKSDIRLSAIGHHLCVQDDYLAEYAMVCQGQNLASWGVTYTVKGPRKDYKSSARFSRSASQNESDRTLPKVPPDMQAATVALRTTIPNLRQSKADSFKSYVWISEAAFLATTELGELLLGHVTTTKGILDYTSQLRWRSIGIYEQLQGTVISVGVSTLGLTLLFGRGGQVLVYQHGTSMITLAPPKPPPDFKIAFAHAQHISERWASYLCREQTSDQCVMTLLASLCSNSATATLYAYRFEAFTILKELKLTLPRSYVVTSALFIEEPMLLITGSRSGDICIYDIALVVTDPSPLKPWHVFENIHGGDAITCIKLVPGTATKNGVHLLSTGRDGRWAIHEIIFLDLDSSVRGVELHTVHQSIPPFGPNIEGAYLNELDQEVVLWGFQGKNFVVWEPRTDWKIMTVECGGAHRNWAYQYREGRGGGNFVWTKASICNVFAQGRPSHEVVQHGGHGREIKSIAVCPTLMTSGLSLVATGAEDTLIHLFTSGPDRQLIRECVLTEHTTGLQALQWSVDGELLFSAAGCEEFMIWRIRNVPYVGIGVVRVAVCPPVSEDKDLRILDFAVMDVQTNSSDSPEDHLITMVYSDSTLRTFLVHAVDRSYRFDLILFGQYTSHCLTQIGYFNLENELYVITGSTDGHLALWPLNKGLESQGFEIVDGSLRYKASKHSSLPASVVCWQHRIAIHQSCIKSLLIFCAVKDDILIATAGDDQALAFTRFTRLTGLGAPDQPPDLPRHSTLLMPDVHTAAITAVALLQVRHSDKGDVYHLTSVGNDQRLKTWELRANLSSIGMEGLTVRKISDIYSPVADTSALQSVKDSDGNQKLYVAGIGLERWSIANDRLHTPSRLPS